MYRDLSEKQILRDCMKQKKLSTYDIQRMAGYRTQSNVMAKLTSNSMRLENFVNLLDLMGYEVLVHEKNTMAHYNCYRVIIPSEKRFANKPWNEQPLGEKRTKE